MAELKKVHIMGIGGSAASGIAQIAQSFGYQVTGCDKEVSTPFLNKVKKSHIPTFVGHDQSHLESVDIVAVSPAIMYQNHNHQEFQAAKKSGKLSTWQEFLGKYLHQNKYVICIAGTHGKSTTTALAGLLLEEAGLDPTVGVGATIPAWKNNVRVGKSKYFISEADEFNDNFLHYHPDIIILNNIEMDHPEYFQTKDRLLDSYLKFILNLKSSGLLIYNADSPWNLEVVTQLDPQWLAQNRIQVMPYTHSDYDSKRFPLALPGNHNKSNAQGVISLAKFLKLPEKAIASTLVSFTGLERRLELLGEKKGIRVYDDYANHPTAFAASISGARQLNPASRILVVIEPHTFSRLRAVLNELRPALEFADRIIISKIYPSRETDPGDFSGADIATATHHPHASYIPEFPDIVSTLRVETHPSDVILVMGSGDSYKLSRQILESL